MKQQHQDMLGFHQQQLNMTPTVPFAHLFACTLYSHVQTPFECETYCMLGGTECQQSVEDTEGRCVVSP